LTNPGTSGGGAEARLRRIQKNALSYIQRSMRIAFSTGRPAHAVLPANLLAQRGEQVTIFTAAYRARFPQLSSDVGLRWVPQFVPSIHFLTGVQLARPWQRTDTVLYDHLVALRIATIREFDIFWAWASGALASGRAARSRGARFVLDRACPHVDAQQVLIQTECERLNVHYQAEPRWFRARQLAEYEEADIILVPSAYSRATFSTGLQSKTLVAPLFGRVPMTQVIITSAAASFSSAQPREEKGGPFTFGTVGGQPLRKGFLYLLRAWKQLQLPNARLLLRTDAPLDRSPVLRGLLRELPNVEIVPYAEDMSDFYRRCDAFVFPTVDDGFGMALLEAMAHGLPAITTTHCGAAELFTPDQDLIVVPAQDVEHLAVAMQRLYSSEETRTSLRSNALLSLRRIEGDGAYQLYSNTLDQILDLVEHGK
jgi:glycosyltransferase involved in cell wall biosynthesis